MAQRTLGAARSMNTFGIFKDHETDWVFKRTLEYMTERGAEIGECLYTARKIDELDPESWIREWAELARKIESQAEESFHRGLTVSARDSFLRASNYYRTAEYGCAPTHPQFHQLWEKSVLCMHRAAALYEWPMTPVEIPFEGKRLPGYYCRPDDSGAPRPTIIVVGGNDSSGEEMLMNAGPAAIRRGYNFFTFEYPGHRGAVHRHPDCVKRPDFEVPFKAAIDYLTPLPGVDERIALAGFSFGGYVASRVAIHEKRIKAVIPDSPIIDLDEIMNAFWGPLFKGLPGPLVEEGMRMRLKKSPLTGNFLRYSLWTWGYTGESLVEGLKSVPAHACNIRADLHRITCPALALVGDGEGEVMIRQAREFYNGIGSQNKQLYTFTLEGDGSNDHCQLDNITRGQQVIYDWLDTLFKGSESRS